MFLVVFINWYLLNWYYWLPGCSSSGWWYNLIWIQKQLTINLRKNQHQREYMVQAWCLTIMIKVCEPFIRELLITWLILTLLVLSLHLSTLEESGLILTTSKCESSKVASLKLRNVITNNFIEFYISYWWNYNVLFGEYWGVLLELQINYHI